MALACSVGRAMAVAVEGDGNLLVTEHLAHDLRVRAGRQLQHTHPDLTPNGAFRRPRLSTR